MDSPKIVFSPQDEPPFPVDALVEEEDTYLSLSAESVIEMPGEHPVRVMDAARRAEEIEPGAVLVRGGHPLKLLAVVHRLSDDPTWREAWILTAVENLRSEIARRQIRALGTPLLGTVHGKLSLSRSFELLAPLLAAGGGLERVWIRSVRAHSR